ncbi:MAG: hypothetical protein WC749_11560 [Dehalococcoidia bacterium]
MTDGASDARGLTDWINGNYMESAIQHDIGRRDFQVRATKLPFFA